MTYLKLKNQFTMCFSNRKMTYQRIRLWYGSQEDPAVQVCWALSMKMVLLFFILANIISSWTTIHGTSKPIFYILSCRLVSDSAHQRTNHNLLQTQYLLIRQPQYWHIFTKDSKKWRKTNCIWQATALHQFTSLIWPSISLTRTTIRSQSSSIKWTWRVSWWEIHASNQTNATHQAHKEVPTIITNFYTKEDSTLWPSTKDTSNNVPLPKTVTPVTNREWSWMQSLTPQTLHSTTYMTSVTGGKMIVLALSMSIQDVRMKLVWWHTWMTPSFNKIGTSETQENGSLAIIRCLPLTYHQERTATFCCQNWSRAILEL